MSEPVSDLRERFEQVAKDAQTLTFAARALELQEDAADQVEGFLTELASAKKEYIETRDETAANMVLSMEAALQSVLSQLRMWIELKRDAGEAAWEHMVSAQDACRAAIAIRRQLQPQYDTSGLENLSRALQAIEQLVFPPQAFMSVGALANERECSTCGEPYDDCDHVRGRVYMGHQCYTIVRKWEPMEVSIVADPANKRCRVTHFTDGDVSRNKMTWRVESSGNQTAAEAE